MSWVTKDWSKFGNIEIEEAKILLSNITKIDCSNLPEVWFNTQSGYVFLSDEDYRVWMMNGREIEEFYSCPQCGHEGFLDEMLHGVDDSECLRYLKEIGA